MENSETKKEMFKKDLQSILRNYGYSHYVFFAAHKSDEELSNRTLAMHGDSKTLKELVWQIIYKDHKTRDIISDASCFEPDAAFEQDGELFAPELVKWLDQIEVIKLDYSN